MTRAAGELMPEARGPDVTGAEESGADASGAEENGAEESGPDGRGADERGCDARGDDARPAEAADGPDIAAETGSARGYSSATGDPATAPAVSEATSTAAA